MPRVKLTKAIVESAEPKGAPYVLWDEALPGFGVRIERSGRRYYWVEYRSRDRKKHSASLGQHGVVTLLQARKAAHEIIAARKLGQNPIADMKRKRTADSALEWRAYVDTYATEHLDKLRNAGERKRLLLGIATERFGGVGINYVTRQDVLALVSQVARKTPTQASNLLAAMRAMYSWAVAREDVHSNPLAGIKTPKTRVRDRVLSDAELALALDRMDAEHILFRSLMRLIVTTGCRRAEAAESRWHEMDLDALMWRIPRERAKNGQAHAIPITSDMAGLLAQIKPTGPRIGAQFIFTTTGTTAVSGITKLIERLQRTETDNAQRWTMHDLRRTFATGMQRLGVRLEVTEALLNHVSGSRGGVAGIYQRHQWAQEKRDAIELWSWFLDEIQRKARLEGHDTPLVIMMDGAATIFRTARAKISW
jgi:integrase